MNVPRDEGRVRSLHRVGFELSQYTNTYTGLGRAEEKKASIPG